MADHQKHAKLKRPALGQFARQEWAVIGTPCGEIQRLADGLIARLHERWKVAYVDADHAKADSSATALPGKIGQGAQLVYTDRIHYHQLEWQGETGPFQFRPLFNATDAAIVNGNHFTARQQIVVIDPRKAESLSRKLDRLTDVQLILYASGGEEIPDFLRSAIPKLSDLPAFRLEEVDAIADWLERQLLTSLPPVRGLVLAGGKSVRMGQDKGLLDYHGAPQREHLYGLMAALGVPPSLSCRADQLATLPKKLAALPDTFLELGPYGAILSAFREDPDAAWLVIACDLPLIDETTIRYLLERRDPMRVATAFQSPVNEFPEPLIAIWEPRAYPVLLQFLSQGYSCPRKVLINADVKLLEAPDPRALHNVNSPEEYREVVEALRSKATN